jgi:hypothetical protein
MGVWGFNLGDEALWGFGGLGASMIGEGGPCPFPSYTLAFALQLRKSVENLSQDLRLVLDTSRGVDLTAFLRQPRLVCWASALLSCPWVTSVNPWLAQMSSKLV